MITRVDDKAGYAAEISFAAPRPRVFAALSTLEGLAGWWTPIVRGDPLAGREVELGFAGLDETIAMRVDQAQAPSLVAWTCLRHTGHPEWQDTTIVFELRERTADSTTLVFKHRGLVPELRCYDVCERGWDSYLASLVRFFETGRGNPFGGHARSEPPTVGWR